MNLWTIVFKTMANANSSGEWPYLVRSENEEEAIAKATETHKRKHPTNTIRRVLQVVELPAHVLG